MYLPTSIDKPNDKTLIPVECDYCNSQIEATYLSAKRNHKKNLGNYRCKKCSNKEGAKKRPQNTSEYWKLEEVKKSHSSSIKNSEKYKTSISNRDTSGEKNGMFSKTASEETRNKMSKSREGKIQSIETITKRQTTRKENQLKRILSGEKLQKGLNITVRQYINSEYKWSTKILIRDEYKCVKCESNKKLDVHHIIPFSVMIKNLLKDTTYITDIEKFQFLVNQPELVDINLINGITLCRKCHREIHKNWGSHNPK